MDMSDWDDIEVPDMTTLTFVGTSSCTPVEDNDTACFLINGHVLVDCGWAAGLTMMRRPEYDATMLTHVLLTHCHQDHYMGLASVLFYRAMRHRPEDAADLTIAGPAEDIERIVDLTMAFLQAEKVPERCPRPEILPLKAGDELRAGELDITTAATRHAVPSLAYRILDMDTGVGIGITGDTAYMPELARFFSGVDHLVTEASTGLEEPPPDNPAGHQSVRQAAKLAKAAGATTLDIVHTDTTNRHEIERVASEVFGSTVHLPQPGGQWSIEDRAADPY
jgi:ribonuclease Z